MPGTHHRCVRLVCLALLILVLNSPTYAYAAKYVVDRHEDNTHYGSAATILVNASPSVDAQRVTSTLVHRTDFNAIAEIGHSWFSPGSPRAFYVWGEWGGYNETPLASVAPGSSHRYWVAYRPSDGKHYYWMDDSSISVASKTISNMTSSWSCVNAERYGAAQIGDNTGCFTILKFNVSWASWSYWNGSRLCDDDDVYYYSSMTSATHMDVKREAY